MSRRLECFFRRARLRFVFRSGPSFQIAAPPERQLLGSFLGGITQPLEYAARFGKEV